MDLPTKEGAFIFQLANGSEVMRFEPDGRCFVRGELVDNNVEVYKAFRSWLAQAHSNLPLIAAPEKAHGPV